MATESVLPGLDAGPRLTHAGVDIVLRDDGHEPVISSVRYKSPPYGQFPTVGRGRDIGGAVVEHYLGSPQWRTARATSHAPVGV